MSDKNFKFGAKDKPSVKDWSPERLGISPITGDLPDKPERVLGDGTYPLNQNNTMRCTAYAISGAIATLKTREQHLKCTPDPTDQWENQMVYPGTATEKNGDYIQSAVKTLKQYGLKILIDGRWETVRIKGYARIRNTDLKNYIAAGYTIFTGSSWRGIDEKGYLKFSGDFLGRHAFFIHSYDNTIEGKPAIARNSWGKWGKIKNGNGDFYIKEKNMGQIMSCYVFDLEIEKTGLIPRAKEFLLKLFKK